MAEQKYQKDMDTLNAATPLLLSPEPKSHNPISLKNRKALVHRSNDNPITKNARSQSNLPSSVPEIINPVSRKARERIKVSYDKPTLKGSGTTTASPLRDLRKPKSESRFSQ